MVFLVYISSLWVIILNDQYADIADPRNFCIRKDSPWLLVEDYIFRLSEQASSVTALATHETNNRCRHEYVGLLMHLTS